MNKELAILDTNIFWVSNGDHPDVSPEATRECLELLKQVRAGRMKIVVDGTGYIAKEYYRFLKGTQGRAASGILCRFLREPRKYFDQTVYLHPIDGDDCEFKELACCEIAKVCLLYTSPSPRDGLLSRMPSSA